MSPSSPLVFKSVVEEVGNFLAPKEAMQFLALCVSIHLHGCVVTSPSTANSMLWPDLHSN